MTYLETAINILIERCSSSANINKEYLIESITRCEEEEEKIPLKIDIKTKRWKLIKFLKDVFITFSLIEMLTLVNVKDTKLVIGKIITDFLKYMFFHLFERDLEQDIVTNEFLLEVYYNLRKFYENYLAYTNNILDINTLEEKVDTLNFQLLELAYKYDKSLEVEPFNIQEKVLKVKDFFRSKKKC